MIARPCPTPACPETVPEGPHAVFCPTCHFKLPYRTTNEIIRLRIELARADDDEDKQHLRDQIDAHVRIAARSLEAGHAA